MFDYRGRAVTTVLISIGLVACGGGDSSGSSGGDGQGGSSGAPGTSSGGVCSDFSPCGGDPRGEWEAESICVEPRIGWSLATVDDRGSVRHLIFPSVPECEGTTSAEAAIAGTHSVAEDGTYDTAYTVTWTVAVNASRDCANALFQHALSNQGVQFRELTDDEFASFCDGTAQFVVDDAVYVAELTPGGLPEECRMVGGACRCAAAASHSYEETGSYVAENDTAADEKGNELEYCATEQSLSVHAPDRNTGTIVLDNSMLLREHVVAYRRADASSESSGGAGGNPDDSVPGPACGNGEFDAGEECDDGNARMADGCNGVCQIEPHYACERPGEPCAFAIVCGDGTLDASELCDDGNVLDGDGCSSGCSSIDDGWTCPEPGVPCQETVEPVVPGSCGDGIVELDEACDDGVNDGSYGGCMPDCRRGPYCGDGVVQAGVEECDDGANTGAYGTCAATCRTGPFCGDGVIQEDEGEMCDDGGAADGDGCSATCRREAD